MEQGVERQTNPAFEAGKPVVGPSFKGTYIVTANGAQTAASAGGVGDPFSTLSFMSDLYLCTYVYAEGWLWLC